MPSSWLKIRNACFSSFLHTVHIFEQPGNVNVVTTCGLIVRCKTHNAPFLPKPDVVTNSRSSSELAENSSLKNTGSPTDILPHGPKFNKLSQT